MILPKKHEYPTKLYFKGAVYKVIFTEKYPRKDAIGLTDFNKQTIYIWKHLGRKEMFKTFFHEVLHMIEAEANIKIKHKTIYQLDEALTEFLLENF